MQTKKNLMIFGDSQLYKSYILIFDFKSTLSRITTNSTDHDIFSKLARSQSQGGILEI